VPDRIDAAGAVVWRPAPEDRTGGTVQIALVHRPRYDDWSLPKGKLEAGESLRTAAAREVAEETGFRIALGRHLGQVRYRVNLPRPASKFVDYYAGRVRDGRFEPNDEVDELRWCTPEAAADVLSYAQDKHIVSSFTELPAELGTVLVVRHAKAGSRNGWDGPDEERPLSANGRHQVPSLRALAGHYAPDRVYSAPLTRCVQTVAQIADDAGVPVLPEPLMSEMGYQGAEERAVARLLEIAADGGTAVVCSQGGVIPDLLSRVAAVAEAAPLPMRRPESKKASVWVLFFTEGGEPELVAAEYVRRP
jgi:8-oxo-dGTP pyrophosphatase MutT (NUDIX family)/broad specificity phosphatase PhoE